MLEFIRKHSSSLGVKIFLTVLALTFVFCFGISDIIRKVMGKDYIAKINHVKISPEMFKFEKSKRMNFLRDKSTKIDDAAVTNVLLHELIWNNVVDSAAQEFGFVISDATMQNYIRGMTIFRDKSGRFNAGMLRGFLQHIHMPEEMFLETSRRDIKSSLIKSPIRFVAITPEAEVYTAANLEKRTINYVVLKPSTFTVKEQPSQEELESFYAEHQEDFSIPESRSFRVVELSEQSLEKGIVVAESEIKDAYDFSSEKEDRTYEEMKAELETTLRQEKLQNVVNDVTRQIEDALMAGDDVDKVAKQFNLQVKAFSDVRLDDEKSLADIAYGKDVVTVAFSIDDGTDSSFSEALDNGKRRVLWLVHVDSVTPKHVAEFSKAANKIKKDWNANRQRELAAEFAGTLVEKMKNGEKLKSLAGKKITCETSAEFDRFGKMANEKNKGNAIVSEVYADVFGGKSAASKTIGSDIVVYQVDRVIQATDIKDEERQRQYSALHKEMVGDIYQQLISYMSKRYKVSVNYELLKEFNEPTERLDDIF